MSVRFLRPTSDLVFKRVFGENPEIVKSFLNSVLPLPQDSLIEEITYLPTEEVPQIPGLRANIVDVKCVDQDGRIFVVEMQTTWSLNFYKRFLFTSSKAIVKQLKAGEDYKSLHPVYGLAIINDIFDNVARPERILHGLEMIFLELPKFVPRDWNDRRMGVLWLRFLKEIDEDVTEIPKDLIAEPYIEQALELAKESAYSLAQLESYDKYIDGVRSYKTSMGDAYDKGMAEGIEKGREEGVEKARIETAKQMLKDGMSKEMIQKYTHLSLEEIKSLANS